MVDLISEINKLNTNWKDILLNIDNEELIKLNDFLTLQKETYEPDLLILPRTELIFNAFNFFNFNELKVVILGQDSYHSIDKKTNKPHAMGLCFSVPNGTSIPPSLKNIYKELNNDIEDFNIPNHGDLTCLAEQGVLLLNSSLSVLQHNAGSHMKHWKKYTDNIIKYISENSNGVVFILWGNFAREKKKLIDINKHHILESGHPSPFSVKTFLNNKHFSKCNDLLENKINWQIS